MSADRARRMGFGLETERLVLRELEASDRDALHAVLGDEETMRYYPHAFSFDETDSWIEWNRASYAAEGFGLWGLVVKETGALVGDCGLTRQEVNARSFVEIGWHVRRDLWGRGLATEAASACRDHGLGPLGLDELVSIVRPENRGSCRVAEKIGMSVWKTTRRGPEEWLHNVYRLTRGAPDPAVD